MPNDDAVAAIWADDRFNRQKEAQLLQAYVESLWERRFDRDDAKAFTIAVDASYGVGKTFFLKRLAKQLSLNFPVAYIDAWSDDLLDDPLTALAATLEDAFEGLKKGKKIRDMLDKVINNAGTVGKIVAIGLLKKATATVIGASTVETVVDAIDSDVNLNDDTKDFLAEEAKETGKLAVETGENSVKAIAARRYMRDRIASFRDGKQALSDLKDSLSSLVESVGEGKSLPVKSPPVIIIVDELDRCRPTYAVKLLEEIKHAFDVHGLVFILGMNGDQLGHSLSGAYGPGFDGPAYLSRFISRRYSLEEVDLTPLLEHLCERVGFNNDMFIWPDLPKGKVTIPEFISLYMQAFELKPRDAFQVVDMIQTCSGLIYGAPLWLGVLLPQIMVKIVNGQNYTANHINLSSNINYQFRVTFDGLQKGLNPSMYASNVIEFAKMSKNDLYQQILNRGEKRFLANQIYEFLHKEKSFASNSISLPSNYDKLVTLIGRFSTHGLITAPATGEGL
ncbi:KAP family P-loop NTPase fold protein [Asticcacaulis excentricus]|uniref:Putative phage protein n=1 Tax=Asticcacaulis excentricus TaxID=78587 RepID=A0A3G9G9M5_9CAUL|nr:P-loop NTPase fold protein [Asticcacaulis excentricus]BBF81864.1 putative phage protein [Asticcacaulis excentricus]